MSQTLSLRLEAGRIASVSPSRSKRVTVIAAKVSGVLLFLFVGIGLLHTPWGHPLLMKLAGVMGCPLGKASAAEVDRARQVAVARDLGATRAPTRPALGFALDQTTLADVRAWETAQGLSCEEAREGSFVKCRDVAASALGETSFGSMTEVTFGFSRSGRLNAVALLQSGLDRKTAMERGQTVAMSNRIALGPPSKSAGSFSAVHETATAGWRFADYSADITVTEVPGSGAVLRDQRLSTHWN